MGLDVTGRYRYPPPNPGWLSGRVETVIDPELPIVDAHHHLWEEAGHPYLLDDILGDVHDGHRIEATVFVQAHYGYRTGGPAHLAPIGETERVAQIAAAAQRRDGGTHIAAAIVGFADLTLGCEVAAVLDAHREAAPSRFRGVRHSVSRDPLFPDGIVLRPSPAGMLADSSYRDGLRTVARNGLSYDAMLYHRQLPELTALARAIPDLPIILDHVGCIIGVGPYEGQEQEAFASWRHDMADLARNPNVTVKIGGFGMIIGGAHFPGRQGDVFLSDVVERVQAPDFGRQRGRAPRPVRWHRPPRLRHSRRSGSSDHGGGPCLTAPRACSTRRHGIAPSPL